MPYRSMIAPATAAAVILAAGAAGLAQDAGGDTYTAPKKPLDERVDRSMVTEYDPPPLPSRVLMPLPARFQVADDAGQVPISREHFVRGSAVMVRGLTYLGRAQEDGGGWITDVRTTPTDTPETPSPVALAVTAMAVKSMVQADANYAQRDEVRRALRFIRSGQNDDGSFEGGGLTNYVTSIVVSSLAAMDRDLVHDEIANAIAWLQASQWDQSEGLNARLDWFGGAGYGKHGRPDMSNTQKMLDALYDSRLSPDEPAFQRALAFVSRAQNLKATNKADWAGNDGGFVYTPANGGESMASQFVGEGRYGESMPEGQPRSLRSYGSMTYAGFKSMLYAGLSADDVRVRAAFDWIRRHWTLDENPGVGQQGLYYYYHTLGRALSVAQQDRILDMQGVEHNWREELIDALEKRQRDDGSWKNSEPRWLEGEPEMATVFALLALQEALKPVERPGAAP